MASSSSPSMSQPQVNVLGSSPSSASACLRLQSDLRSIRIEPPEVKIREMFISLLSDKRFRSCFVLRFMRVSLTRFTSFLDNIRAVRRPRTRTITCSSGRRRFVAHKTHLGKAAYSPYV